MHTITRTTLAALVALPLVVASCGDDDEAATNTTTAPQTDDDYVAAGTAICRDAGPRIVEAFPDPVGEPDLPYLREIAGPIADVMEDTGEEFAALEPPASEADGHQRLLDEIDQAVSELRAVLDDDDAAEMMLEDGPPLDGPAAAAAALGFEDCGGG